MDVNIWVLLTKTVKSRSKRELPFISYMYNNLRTVDSEDISECNEEREDKLGLAVPRSVTGISGRYCQPEVVKPK